MRITLSPELEEFVRDQVASGQFASPGDLVHEAIRLLQERSVERRERIEALKREIQIGIEDLNAGRSVRLDEATLDGIKKRGRERLSRHNTPEG